MTEENIQPSLDSIQGRYIYTPRNGSNGDSEISSSRSPKPTESPVKETRDTTSDIKIIPPSPIISSYESEDNLNQESPDNINKEAAYYANQLVAEQSQNIAPASILSEIGRSIGSPSLLRYLLILLFFALPNDLIDFFDFTVVLMPLSWFISLFLSVSTIFFMWFSDSELKRVQGNMEKIETHKKALTKTATKISSRLIKFAPKNPLVKVVSGCILELIPIINMLPWSCICVYLAYRDERATFKEAQKELDAVYSQVSEVTPEMV